VIKLGRFQVVLDTPECGGKQYQERENFQATQQHGKAQDSLAGLTDVSETVGDTGYANPQVIE
jgi:hypothetical protein